MSSAIQVVADFDLGAGLAQLGEHRIEMLRSRSLDPHAPAGDRAGHEVGAGLDAIGQHVVTGAGESLDALYDDGVGAGAANLRAHGIEKVGKVDHFGLARRVLDDGLAFRECRSHQQVLRAGHGYGFENQPRPAQPRGTCTDVAILDQDVGAELLQPVDVNVHRTRADRAAAGQRHVGLAETRQQRTEHEDRSAHRAHQLVGSDVIADRAGIDFHAHLVVDRDADAHAAEQLDHGRHVLQVRDIADRHGAFRQQGGGENRQCGVLGAGNAHFAFERRAALDLQLIHRSWLPAG